MPRIVAKQGIRNAYVGCREDSNGVSSALPGAVVLILSSLAVEAPEGVIDAGLKVQLASEGSPLQLRVTCELNPFTGVIVTVAVPLWPAAILREPVPNVKLKVGVGHA